MARTTMTESRKRERCENEPTPAAKKQSLGRDKCQLNSNITLHRIDTDTYNSRLSSYSAPRSTRAAAKDFERAGIFCVRKDISGLVDANDPLETVAPKCFHTIVVDCGN